jgi:SAM-dependent methyltransferase
MANSIWGTQVDIWPTIPSPFSPSSEDLRLYQQACPPELLAEGSAPRILVLGVTPQLTNAPWPRDAELHAVDYDEQMIATLWKPREGAQCHQVRWQDMPFEDAYFDVIVGDCAFNALPSQDEYEGVLRQVARVRRPGAPLITRFFVQPDPRPTLAQVVDLARSELADLSPPAKRLLVYMASSDAESRLCNPEGAERIREQWGDLESFLGAMGQTPEDMELTKLVLTFDQRVHYPNEQDIRRRFAPFFGDIGFTYPATTIGQRCPIVRFS